MRTSAETLNIIDKFKEGYVFTYDELGFEPEKTNAVIIALNRMVKSGKLKKISKGRYYKPQMTEFGELKPDTYQIVKDLLQKDKKVIGYLTGFSVFNSLFLTTQVSNTIQIGFNNEKKAITRGMYKIRFIKQTNKITEDNIPMLQMLDSIRFIKDIPDTGQNQSCNRFIAIVKELSPERLNKLKKLVLKYNASTRALTGAIIDMLENDNSTQTIFESLNPATSYNFSISERTLPTKDKWRIK
ncbi:MAG: hypothetical protein GY834_03475 [Bacteroidetes bacterium]|nr:hypothetical protein [Bacteroidota bacterium]